MFPRGAPGIALVVLRFAVAATLWTSGAPAVLRLLAFPLGLGVLTPAAAVVCGLVHAARLLGGEPGSMLPIVVAIANAAALALLGPGAYSIDSRLFGRRVFVVSGGS
jgi:uncharacterized membrane protein YphA (DoxX/SURF4 family)